MFWDALPMLTVHWSVSRGLCCVRSSACKSIMPSTTSIRHVSLSVDKQSVLADEKVQVKVTGLTTGQKVTVHATIHEGNARFASFAHFVCRHSEGTVDLATDASLYGTYTGVSQMGLIWSMIQEPGNKKMLRLTKRDVTTPQVVNLYVHQGHVGWEQLLNPNSDFVLANSSLRRWYLSSNTTRINVREGKLRGTLFAPKGKGPFPAVMDLFGGAGGLIEFKGALLASRGFVVLCLSYFGFEDLPKSYKDLDLLYIEEGMHYLLNQPQVLQSAGIGMYCVSKGGEIAYLMAEQCPQVKAIVNVNGPPFISSYDIRRGKERLKKAVPHSQQAFQESAVELRKAFPYTTGDLVKIEKSNAKFLVLVGEDDKNIDPNCHRLFYYSLSEEKKANVEMVFYPGTGHLIEPPYAPMCAESSWTVTHPAYKGLVSLHGDKEIPHEEQGTLVWGGNSLDHSKAQEDAWGRILQHFRANLMPHKSHL